MALNVILDPAVPRARVKGKCKYWNEEKKFGFLVSNDDSTEVFVNVDGIQNGNSLIKGQAVEYTVHHNPLKGKKSAVRVLKLDKGGDTASSETDVSSNEQHKGSVVYYNAEKNFGFIQWEGDNELFVHINDCKVDRLTAGDAVTFKIRRDPKGRDIATNVNLDDGIVKERYRGTCIHWNLEMGIGTIARDRDGVAGGGREFFMHFDDLDGGGNCLQIGDRVEFELNINPEYQNERAARVSKIEPDAGGIGDGSKETYAEDDVLSTSGKGAEHESDGDDDIFI